MPREADRNGDDGQDASSASQSKRPSLRHRDASDYSQTSDHTRDSASSTREHQHRPKHHHHHHHQKHVVGGGRLHARIPSSKALHKQQGTAHASKLNNNRRHHSPSPERERDGEPERDRTERPRKPGHRRVQSEAKLSRDSSSSNLKSSTSAASLRRNRSHVEVAHKRTKSSDKLKRTASNPAVNKVKASSKSQVHFDLGSDGQEDEWVDASGSASPYLSRRGSMASGQGSAKPGSSAGTSSRPHTPADKASPPSPPSPPVMSTPDRQTLQHKEYLTSRLLQRTPSQGAPPQVTNDTAEPVSRNRSPDSFGRQSTLDDDSNSVNAAGSAGGDELTSRFVGAASSGNTRNSSFYHPDPSRPTSRRSDAAPDTPHRALSTTSSNRTPASGNSDIDDTSALAPRNARRNAPQSRVQQKLNLQRASSVIEPSSSGNHTSAHHHTGGMSTMGLGMGMGMGMSLGGPNTVGATPLVAVANPGHDGGASRDPRVAKQLERTGMEYLSVRRYQNPVVRSLDRVAALQAAKKPQRIPHRRNGLVVAAKPPALRPAGVGHTRNVSLGAASAAGNSNSSRPVTPRAQSVRTLRSTGAGSSFEAEGGATTQLSGSSLVGGEDEDGAGDGLNALLRNLWEKNMNLSASQD
ncbi:hypothetical protein ACHAQH_005601 [Verticillium albo-atrum]